MNCPECNIRLKLTYINAGSSTSVIPWLYCEDCERVFNIELYQSQIQKFFSKHIPFENFQVRISFQEDGHLFEITGPQQLDIFPIFLHLKQFIDYSWKLQLRQFIEPIIAMMNEFNRIQELLQDQAS